MAKKSKIIILLILSLIIVFPGLQVNGGPDTYVAISHFDRFLRIPINNGRPFQALFFLIIGSVAKYSYKGAYYLSYILTVFLFVIGEYRYSVLLLDHNWHASHLYKAIMLILSGITILNIFSTEYFMCPEVNPTWGFAMVMCIEAVIAYFKFIKEKKYRFFWCSFFFLLATAFSYQILLSVFIILTVSLLLAKNEAIQSFARNSIMAALLYFVALGINWGYTKLLMNNTRVEATSLSVVESLKKYSSSGISKKVSILDRISMGMWIYAVLCLSTVCILIVAAIKKNKMIEIGKGFLIVCITVIMGMLPYITRMSDDYSPRLYYPLGMVVGLLLNYSMKVNLISTISLQKTVCVIIAVACLNQLFTNVQIFSDRYMTNYDDRNLAMIYGECISRYERENNIKIENVCFYQDAIRTKYIRYTGWCLSMRVFGVEWGNLEALNYYLHSEYASGSYNEQIAEEFEKKDWDCFSTEQIVFDGKTVHICKY